MREAIVASTAILLQFAAVSSAQDLSTQIDAVEQRRRAGDLDGALRQVESLLEAEGLDQPSRQRVRALAASVLHERGEVHFRQARIAESIADFDRQLQLQPDQAAGHWQRGIACYYADQCEEGARQFQLHRTVNPEDVENAAWHFLCVARGPKGTVDAARENLIPIKGDARAPMAEIHQMFAGGLSPEAVLRTGGAAGGTAQFYAELYVGLYFESLGNEGESLRLMQAAAENPAAKNGYMGDVARVHVRLRTKDAPAAKGLTVTGAK